MQGLVKRKGNWLVVEEWVLDFESDLLSINAAGARGDFPGGDRLNLTWNSRCMKLVRSEIPDRDQEIFEEEVAVNPITGLPDKQP